ncbi:cryptochrome dash-like [Plakobranchus ocellatus]|uniref:Cryptochrome dash-like n=1 Tax=Plakobranchus ocellatus TaxID=259542 RepID=A0AAV3YFH4_9GAST|nr:cryptochrome dash-like [Plakobranchus ocellatus]
MPFAANPQSLSPVYGATHYTMLKTCLSKQNMLQKDERSVFPFKGGESSGLIRLQDYLWGTDYVSTYIYKETRNGMIGSDYSTKFSPWLAHGCISPQKIYWEIKMYENERTSNQSTYWTSSMGSGKGRTGAPESAKGKGQGSSSYRGHGSQAQYPGQKRGIDFYFSSSNKR